MVHKVENAKGGGGGGVGGAHYGHFFKIMCKIKIKNLNLLNFDFIPIANF